MILDGEKTVYGHIGRTLYSVYSSEDIDGGVLIHIGSANLTVRTVRDDAADARGIQVKWDSLEPLRFEDCLDFGKYCSLTPQYTPTRILWRITVAQLSLTNNELIFYAMQSKMLHTLQ